ncbi:putative Zinc finger, UBP-type, Zinc finger, RING-type, BRCA1-associated 2 [Plasmopara halstedii]
MFQIRVEAADIVEEEEVKAEEPLHENANDFQSASFLAGNPQVRVITGRLRFYRADKSYLTSSSASPIQQLPSERSTLVCVVTVPSHMSPVEILEFLASFRDDIALLRVLKDPERSNCMALMQFNSQERADQFFADHNGKYFNSIEQERCKIVFVRSIEFDPVASKDESECDALETKFQEKEDVTTLQLSPRSERRASSAQMRKLFPPPPNGMTEIPTCAVCLDRLDASASGILTTLCNHSFHCDCLFRWEGSSCPVCRYSHGDIGSSCEVCSTVEHLWICLICGHVGCGRYSGEHAKQHYQETLHTYSLELETQRVWDYAGDGYVHRLILNKQDGKFVEFPSPYNLSGERSQRPPTTSAEDEEDEHRKLEKLAVEYNFLLKSQLEEQRLYYERLLARVEEGKSRQLLNAHEHERKQLKKTNLVLEEKTKKLEEELTFVRELNKSLIENQKQWKERVRALEDANARIERDTALRVGDLESQVRDLMFYLDTQNKVEQSVHCEDIKGGTIEIESEATIKDRASEAPIRRKGKKRR